MDRDRALAIVREMRRRRILKDPPYLRPGAITAPQRKFYEDPSLRKAALCSRRAGKTTIVLRILRKIAEENPHSIVVFMGISKSSAMNLAWKPMQRLLKEYPTPNSDWSFNKVDAQAHLPNGSQFWVLGADKEPDMEKLRGNAFHAVAIDESASFRSHLKALVEDVIEPALGDYRGQLLFCGTPGATPAGYFYDVTTEKPGHGDWSVHRWTVLENNLFPRDPKEWIAEVLRKKQWTTDNPVFRREYMGEWYLDQSGLVYRWNTERNGIFLRDVPKPIGEYNLILSMDFGVVDACAFSVLGYHEYHPDIVVFESYKKEALAPSDAADHARWLQRRYGRLRNRPPEQAFESQVGDTGGIGKGFVEEMAKRHRIYVKPAEKRAKLSNIQHLNGDLISGRMKWCMETCEEAITEAEQLPWLDDQHTKYDEKRFPDHCLDSILYGFMEAYHYRSEDEAKAPPPPGTSARMDFEALAEELAAAEEERRRAEDPFGWDQEMGYDMEELY